jgi:hypothetical protein
VDGALAIDESNFDSGGLRTLCHPLSQGCSRVCAWDDGKLPPSIHDRRR